jgi:MFS family permease
VKAAALSGYTLTEALRGRNFWMLSTIAFCTFYSIIAMSATTFTFLRVENYSPQISATGVTVLFIGGLVGKIISGQLAESLGRVGLVGFGFGWGGIYTLIQLLAADLFGLRSLGKILGAVNVLDTLGAALGPWVTALLFDRTGSFLVSFSVITALLVIATLCAALLDMSKAAYLQSQPSAQ